MSYWTLDGKLITNEEGKPINCDNCPCGGKKNWCVAVGRANIQSYTKTEEPLHPLHRCYDKNGVFGVHEPTWCWQISWGTIEEVMQEIGWAKREEFIDGNISAWRSDFANTTMFRYQLKYTFVPSGSCAEYIPNPEDTEILADPIIEGICQ